MPLPSPMLLAVVMVLFASIVGAWISVILRLALKQPVLPPSTPLVVPWGAGSVLAAFLGWVLLNGVVSTAYLKAIRPRMAVAGVEAGKDLSPGELMALVSFQNTATLLLIPLILAATTGARRRDFGIAAEGLGRKVAQGIFAYPLLAPVVMGVMGLSVLVWGGRTPHPVEEAIAQNRSPGLVALSALAAVVLAPAAEELIFRGVLLGWLTRLALGRKGRSASRPQDDGLGEFLEGDRDAHLLEAIEIDSPEEAPGPGPLPDESEHPNFNPYSPPTSPIATDPEAGPHVPTGGWPGLWLANVAVSLVFAALHGKVWPTPIPIFFLSLGLGFLYQRTGGIVASTALHMTFNGVSTLLMFLTLGNAPAPKPGPKAPVVPPVTIPAKAAMGNFPWGAR